MSRIGSLFNFREEHAKGRSCMALSAALVMTISNISAGMFYTSFMTSHGINIVELGILTFIPFIANCFSIFSPSILERFKKRRFVLGGGRLLYYTLELLAVTLMPYFVKDPALKMTLFISIVFAANIINSLFSGGYSVWHVNFIPEEVRANFFAANTLITAVISGVTSLGASIVADMLTGSAYEETVIVVLRVTAYMLGILDVVILSLPKEYPYKQEQAHPRLRDIFVMPLQNRRFALTMLIVFLYGFFAQVPASSMTYFLVNTIGVEYTLVGVVNMMWPLFLFAFLPLWQKVLRKLGWLKTFALAQALHMPTTLLYSFISPVNYMWLMTTVRLIQHVLGVGRSLTWSNILYINLPETDQTNYVSFHTLTTNVAAFLGMMTGTSFVSAFPDLSLRMFGTNFCNVQVLMWVQMFGELFVPFLLLLLLPKLQKPAEQK